MKYQQHHLTEKNDPMSCPLNRAYICDSRCAWFDHESCDCRMVQKQKPIDNTELTNYFD